jgi:hypothetical protein
VRARRVELTDSGGDLIVSLGGVDGWVEKERATVSGWRRTLNCGDCGGSPSAMAYPMVPPKVRTEIVRAETTPMKSGGVDS